VAPELDLHAPLDDVRALAAAHGIVLVPRLLAPIPDDGHRPTEADVARGGNFESGVLAAGAGGRGYRLGACGVGPLDGPGAAGASPLDLAPVLFPAALVLREPGHCVAYWNLPGRPLESLRSFYFTEFDPRRAHWLSDNNTRVRVTESQPLATLCDSFAARLL